METKPKVKRVTKKSKDLPESVSETVNSATSDVPIVNDAENDTTKSKAIPQKEIRLSDIPVADEITALNLMVSFLGLAQKRGAYTIDEASKIWECIKKFQRPVEQSST